jgi:hypothetical protein
MPFVALAFAALALCLPASAQQNNRFEQFYPEFSQAFTDTVVNNCSAIFQQYLDSRSEIVSPLCNLMIDCVLTNTHEFIKSDMASANVVLGLLPTILALLGSTTPELALLSSRRPLLALLLSIGSPTVNPIRTFEYHDPIEALRQGRGVVGQNLFCSDHKSRLLVVFELITTGAALANIWTVSLQLGQRTVNTRSCNSIWLEMLWVGLAVIIHFFGTLAFASRSKFEYPSRNKSHALIKKLTEWVGRWAQSEFAPCATHTKHTLSWQQENLWFLFFSWWASIMTVAHIIYGTAVFSSIAFIGVFLKPLFPR